MVYLVKTKKGQESYNITNFFAEEKNWKTYLILVIAKPDEELLLAKQIIRQYLDEANWLICTPEDLKNLFTKDFRRTDFWDLIVMELTFTGSKKDVLTGHNNELMLIAHDPKTKPFDQAFADVINRLIDQALYNYLDESASFRKKLNLMFIDLMKSGMFKMQHDPEKAMGN